MADVLIALIPVFIAGIYAFGLSALWVILVSVASSVLFEFLYNKITKQPNTIGDLSAVVTGAILAINLPATVPLWIPVLGSAFAIILVKCLFGGLGHNFMNPALGARVFLLMSFAGIMTAYPTTVRLIKGFSTVVSEATPLQAVASGEEINWATMILEMHSGCIGEASVIAILIGFAYLLIRRTIASKIPLIYVASTVVFVVLIAIFRGKAETLTLNYIVAQICGGGLLLGAVFMATDYVTSPATPMGQAIYAVLLGLITALIRLVSSGAEGVSYAIIIGNMLSPLIDRFLSPAYFGKGSRSFAEPKKSKEATAK
ncbi:MAG: RnfABCDGE type electron transport complex subunit D [Clostridia bacterium]|nr:RnfABCDGE type electron transport complex subunit D [Clostridia bacterium]